MITTIEDFIRYIPTARGTHFEDIEPFLIEAKAWAESDIFGRDLVAAIDASDDDDAKRMLNSIVALKAYSAAIPFLDVVQTSNGFAVVNNTNVVPASRERVDKLLEWVNDRLYYHVDSLIEYISAKTAFMAEWRKSLRFNYLTELLFWTGTGFASNCGNYEAVYKQKRGFPFVDLHKMHATIKGFQYVEMANYISRDYISELIDKRRNQTLDTDDEIMMSRLRQIIGLFLQKEQYKATEALKEIVNLMIKEPDKYTAYAGSDEYRLKMAERYQNKKEDSTYFFV